MIRVGFVHGDKLFELVKAAREAVFNLSVEVHYLSCQGGVGRLKDKEEQQNDSARNHR